MNAIHPSQDANDQESVSPSVSARVTLYSWEFTNFVMFYQDYPSIPARMLAVNLANLYRESIGFAFITQVELASRMNLSVQQTRLLLKEVEATGYWKVKRGSYSKKEATQYAPTSTELERAKRWKLARFDSNVSFTDPMVPAKTTKVVSRNPDGFNTPEARSTRKSNAPVEETPYEFLEVEVPEWGRASEPECDETDAAWDTPETQEPAISNEPEVAIVATQDKPRDTEYESETTAPASTQAALNEHMDPFAGPHSTAPARDTGWEREPEPDDNLDAFGNPYVITYDAPSNPRTYL